MKTLLLLAFSFTTALAPVAWAKEKDEAKADQVKATKHRSPAAQTVKPVGPRGPSGMGPKTQRNIPSVAPKVNPVQPSIRPNVQADVRVRQNPDIRPNPDMPRTRGPHITPNVQADVNVRDKNWDNNRNRHDNNKNRNDNNWRTRTSHSNNWEQARRHRHHDHHDRNWWRSRYTRFALFGTGYYYWDNGYWFPAYGYDSGYNTYSYDEPIYSYGELEPAQVISNVQTELQRLGYYNYAVDGTMGPATRAALSNYQRDQGLPITSAIDESTLDSLGLN